MQRIDVIIPCYNYGRFLRDCLHSVLTQDGCVVRVLLIDDCSTDDSLVTARALVAGEPRVELRAHEVNKGHIATYNEGIDWLSAPFMLLLSADDIVAPGAFARALALMDRARTWPFCTDRVCASATAQLCPPGCPPGRRRPAGAPAAPISRRSVIGR